MHRNGGKKSQINKVRTFLLHATTTPAGFVAPCRAILRHYISLRYPTSPDTFKKSLGTLPKLYDPPLILSFTQIHLCDTHFATYRAIIVRYPTKASMKEFCDTIATSTVRYEKYRYWAAELAGVASLAGRGWESANTVWNRLEEV